jgi:hypothetical protein
MKTERETTRIARSWLEMGADRLPDRVLDSVLDQLPAYKQRRSLWRPPWRFAQMNAYAKVAIAAAAVLVVAILGYKLLPGADGPGGQSTPTPEPTEVPRLPTSGALAAGTYRMGNGPTLQVTVPAGWVSAGGMSVRKNLDQPNEVALDVWPADIRVFANACQSEGTEQPIGPTVDDLIAALQAQENSDLTDPVAVTVAGVPGFRLEISAPAGLDITQCSIESLQIWVDAGGTNYLAGVGHPPAVAIVYVADTPAGRLHYGSGSSEAASAADIAELDAVVASIEIVE